MASSSRCSPSGPSTSTARSSGPCSRSRLRWASANKVSQVAMDGTRTCHSNGASDSGKYSARHCSLLWLKRRRKASCCSTTASSACSRHWASRGATGSSSSAWFQCCGCGMRLSKNQCWIGVSGVSPLSSPCSALMRWRRLATHARVCTVWCWNRSRGVKWMPSWRARLTTWIDRIESPPSSKKLSLRPTCCTFSTSHQIRARLCSNSLLGATYCWRLSSGSGTGKARRSSLPLAVSGRLDSRIR